MEVDQVVVRVLRYAGTHVRDRDFCKELAISHMVKEKTEKQ